MPSSALGVALSFPPILEMPLSWAGTGKRGCRKEQIPSGISASLLFQLYKHLQVPGHRNRQVLQRVATHREHIVRTVMRVISEHERAGVQGSLCQLEYVRVEAFGAV